MLNSSIYKVKEKNNILPVTFYKSNDTFSSVGIDSLTLYCDNSNVELLSHHNMMFRKRATEMIRKGDKSQGIKLEFVNNIFVY